MCTPTAMVVTTLLSTAMQMKAASDESKYEAGVSRYNARVAENTAQKVQNVGVEKENAQRLKTARLLSEQKTQLGALNVDIGSGSALQIQQDTQTLGDVDALRIRSNTGDQVESLLTKADLQEHQAGAQEIAGRNKATGSLLKGISTVASTGVADKWFKSDSAGVTV